ncbi:MAG: hypothetical protein WB616_14015 [Candidatus Sulfotelmatobacter sp.]
MRAPQVKQKGKTSEVASEVLKGNPSDCETEVVIAQSLKIAKRVHSVIGFVAIHKEWIIELRKRFGVSQGQAGKTLNIEGKDIYWHQFVKDYFNVSCRWMNELLGIKEKSKPNPKRKRDEEKPLYQRGFQAGRQSVEGVAEIDRKIGDGINLKYETRIVELEKELRASKTLSYKAMLAKLIAEVEKSGEGVPVSVTRLAQNLREQMEKLDKAAPAIMVPHITDVQKKEPKPTQSEQVIAAIA